MANREGNAVRALAGLKNVAIEFIEEVWKGTGKSIALCPKGRGFGSKFDRAGGQSQDQTPKDVPSPVCETCNKTMKFVAGGMSGGKKYDPFWACPDKKRVDGKWNEHSSINDAQYRQELAKKQPRQPGEDDK